MNKNFKFYLCVWAVLVAIFNVADSFVCIGVGLFALAVIREEIQSAKKAKEAKLALEVEENAEDNTESDS